MPLLIWLAFTSEVLCREHFVFKMHISFRDLRIKCAAEKEESLRYRKVQKCNLKHDVLCHFYVLQSNCWIWFAVWLICRFWSGVLLNCECAWVAWIICHLFWCFLLSLFFNSLETKFASPPQILFTEFCLRCKINYDESMPRIELSLHHLYGKDRLENSFCIPITVYLSMFLDPRRFA